MKIQKLLLAVSAAAVLMTAGASVAMADPYDHDRMHHVDRDRHDDRRGGEHDRYWRPEYRGGFVDRDRVFFGLRQHHFTRFVGDPYWYQGRYVVRSYDRFGRVVFVEVNPYTGGFIGVVRF